MRRFLAFAFMILSLAICAVAQNRWSTWIFNGMTTPVKINDPARYDAFAAMVRLSNGKILNFYRNGTSHTADRGVIVLLTSTNDGATWTPFSGTNYCLGPDVAGCLFSDTSANQYNSENVAASLSYDGSTVVVMWDEENWQGVPIGGVPTDSSAGLKYSKSTDGGVTWATPTALGMSGFYTYAQMMPIPSGAGANATVPGGSCSTGCLINYVCTNAAGSCGGTNGKLIFSYDNGATWNSQTSTIPNGMIYEAGRAWISGNQLILLGRPNASNNMVFAYTNDLGGTWSSLLSTNIAHTPTPAGCSIGGQGTQIVSPLIIVPTPAHSDGTITVMYAERDDFQGTCPSALAGTYDFLIQSITFIPSVVIASPTSFPLPQTIISPPGVTAVSNFGYPAAVETSLDKLLIEYYLQFNIFNTSETNLFTMSASYSRPPAPARLFAKAIRADQAFAKRF